MDQFMYTYLIDGYYYYLFKEFLPGFEQAPSATVGSGDTRYYWAVADTVNTNQDGTAQAESACRAFRPLSGRDPIISPLEGSGPPTYQCDKEFYRGDCVIPSTVSYKGVDYIVSCLGEHAMACNPNLTSVKFPSSVWRIEQLAFFKCPKLESIEIPHDTPSFFLGERALEGTALTEVWLPDSMSELQNFCYYDNKIKIRFSENQAVYDEGYAPILRGGAIKYHNIEEGVFLLPRSRFMLCEGSVTGVKTVVIPPTDRFASQEKAIAGCETIVSMAAEPPVVENPGEWLYYWAGYRYYTEDDRTKEFGLRDAKPTGLAADYENVTLVVPTGSEEAYRSAPVWCEFKTIVGKDSFVEYLGAGIGDTSDDGADVRVDIDGDGITVTAGSMMQTSVFDTSGRLVGSGVATGESPLRLALRPGFYIVRTGATSHKIKI
ncbi:MAG: leucine-rich repeat domain-containing protein, partial [Paramuribaculum sp.]|nr:leucine-rich repeat domain-containing protein [Paramuribaculum sp.]